MSLFNWRKKKKEKNDFIDLKNSFVDRPTKLSNPYVIKIQNTVSEAKEWVLLGSNLHLMADNFGNHKAIKVENIGTNTPYHALLIEHISQRTRIGKMRFQSSNQSNLNKHNFKVIKQLLSSGWFQDSGVTKDIPLAIMMDAYQMQSEILDLTIEFDLDRYTHLSGTIEGNSELVISMFPIEIEQERYKTTRLSGKNVAPVVISVSNDNPKKRKIVSFVDYIKSFFKDKSAKSKKEEIKAAVDKTNEESDNIYNDKW